MYYWEKSILGLIDPNNSTYKQKVRLHFIVNEKILPQSNQIYMSCYGNTFFRCLTKDTYTDWKKLPPEVQICNLNRFHFTLITLHFTLFRFYFTFTSPSLSFNFQFYSNLNSLHFSFSSFSPQFELIFTSFSLHFHNTWH